MEFLKKVAAVVKGSEHGAPVRRFHVVDPSPMNWLWIIHNTVEELVRVAPSGLVDPAAMTAYRWADDTTLMVDVRSGEVFPDSQPLTAASVKRAFDEMMRWRSPHPPGTQFNLDPGTTCEVTGDLGLRFRLLQPDGGAVAKPRAMHVMSPRFWGEVGFGYARIDSSEGRC